MKFKRITIRGKRWKLIFGKTAKGIDGLCDLEAKTITVNDRLKGERLLDVLLHEILHAAHWDLDEAAVAETATDAARIAWGLGWRLER